MYPIVTQICSLNMASDRYEGGTDCPHEAMGMKQPEYRYIYLTVWTPMKMKWNRGDWTVGIGTYLQQAVNENLYISKLYPAVEDEPYSEGQYDAIC